MYRLETVYDRPCLQAMARAMRKSVRRKRSRISYILGWLLMLVVVLMWIPILRGYRGAEFSDIMSLLAAIMVALVEWQEDRLNAWLAGKRMLPSQAEAATTFDEEGYVCVTEAATTEWKYAAGHITAICETKDHLIFILNKTYAQGYDKRTLSGGSLEDFYRFLEEKTGVKIKKI